MAELNKKRITLCAALLVITACPVAYGSSNFLPSPFPLCPVDENFSGFQSQIDAGYSAVTTDSVDLGCSCLVVRGVIANNEVGSPSFHFTLNGAMVHGEQQLKSNYNFYGGGNIASENDVDGYLVGASFTPSLIISDYFSMFKPSFFLGTNIQLQAMDMIMADDFFYMMNFQLIGLSLCLIRLRTYEAKIKLFLPVFTQVSSLASATGPRLFHRL